MSVSYAGKALTPSNGSFTLNLQGNDSVFQSSFTVTPNGASGAAGSVAQENGGWKLTVTAQDGTTANYPILINRNMTAQTPVTPVSADVKSVTYDGKALKRNGNMFTLELGPNDAIPADGTKFIVDPEDTSAHVSGVAKNGSSSFKFTVTPAAGTAETYFIFISKTSTGGSDEENQNAVNAAYQKVDAIKNWDVDMAAANSSSMVETFIRTKLNRAYLGAGIGYDITVAVNPAKAGTESSKGGTSGSYTATIVLRKGSAESQKLYVGGTIAPTPYQAKPTGTITVYFTLLGDSAHGSSGYTHTLSGGNLTAWIPRQTVTLSAGSTVYDVFTTVLDQYGYSYIGADSNYVKTITHPNGTTLSEFTNGRNSGWMYTVNGTHPNQGLKAWTVYNGNEIIWHYTDDYTKEEGRTSSSANAGTSAQLTPTVSGSTATISSTDLSDALNSAISSGSGTILITPRGGTSESSLTVNLPTSTMYSAASNNVGVTVQSGPGTVAIPSYALAGIASMANGTQVSITTTAKSSQQGVNLLSGLTGLTAAQLSNSSVTEVSMASGGRSIANWGGRAITLSLPVSSMNFTAGSRYTVYQVSADGSVETHIGYCSRQNGALYVEISATHLSTFVVVPTANVGTTAPNALPFRDVTTADRFYEDVAYAYGSGLFYGDSQTSFSPYGKMNRAMLVTVLYRFEGEPAASRNSGFTDVASGQWFTNGVAWASGISVVNGKGNGRFAPYDNITREEIATILYRYAKIKGLDVTASASLGAFSDGAQTSDWAARAMQWAYAKGIINGKGGGMLDPGGHATCAEVAAMMKRFIEAY